MLLPCKALVNISAVNKPRGCCLSAGSEDGGGGGGGGKEGNC